MERNEKTVLFVSSEKSTLLSYNFSLSNVSLSSDLKDHKITAKNRLEPSISMSIRNKRRGMIGVESRMG